MKNTLDLEDAYMQSDEVVSREIEGELIIVPLTSGVGDLEDELYTLNQTGRAIWGSLDGRRKVKDVVNRLSKEFNAPHDEIKNGVIGLMKELLKRQMIVKSLDI